MAHCAVAPAPRGSVRGGGFAVVAVGLMQRGISTSAENYIRVEFEYAPAPRPRAVLLHWGLVPGRVVQAAAAFWAGLTIVPFSAPLNPFCP